MSISNYAENKLLDTLRNVSFSVATCYVKLHISDAGEDGTTGAAAETTRKAVTWSAAASGSMATASSLTWTNVSTTETYSHWSMWDTVGPTGGNCLWTGALSSTAAVTAGDTFEITSLTLTLD